MSLDSQPNTQILHVDDEPDFADLAATFLERIDENFAVETATSAQDGLDIIETQPPDCIVSDYNMPGMDGIEFLQAVREQHPDIPFILFTGKGSEAVAADAISAGVTDYLQKRSGSEQYELLANRIRHAVTARQDAEEATRQQDLMKRTEVLAATGGWELIVESEDLRLTDGIKKIYGVEADRELSLEEVMELYEPESQEQIRKIIDGAVESGYAETDELHLQTANGDHRIVKGNAELVETDTDQTILRGVIHDITNRHEQQQELQLLQQAIDDANVAITLADPSQSDEPLVYVNTAFEEMTGYPPEETLGRNCRFLQGEDTDPQKAATLREAINNEESVSVELRNYRKDGTKFWNRVTVTPIYDDNGRLVRYLGTQEDVTTRKERERELKAERRFIRQAIDGLDDLFYVIDTDGRFRRWNKTCNEVTGYDDSELADMQVTQVFPEKDRQTVENAVETALSEGKVTFEAPLQTADGTDIPYEFTGARLIDEDGSITGIVGIGRDITSRKERERELDQTRDLMANMEQLADVGAWKYDANTEELTNTPGARAIQNIERESEMSLDEAFELFHADDRTRLRTRFRECLETGKPYEIDVRLSLPNGEQRWVTARGQRVQTTQEEPAVRGSIQDITEQINREQQLTDLNETLQNLLMTDNIEDVADIGVTAAEDILDFSVNAVYLIGSDEKELKPVAHTKKVASVLGDVQSLPVDDSVAGRVYRRGESTAIDDVQQDSDVYNPESDLRAHMYLPLADHGVLIAGSEEKGVFDNHDIALAEILAGNLTAALDRIERDQAVRKQEQKLSLFFEDSPIGAVQWDEDFNFDRLNKRAEEILGYNEEELDGESWETIVADEDRDHVGNVVEQLLTANGGNHAVNKNVRKDGETRICKWHNRAVTDSDGNVRTIFSKFEDITEREERKERLREVKNQYQTLVENFPNGAVLLCDADLEIVRAGGNELSEIGLSVKEIEGTVLDGQDMSEVGEQLVQHHKSAFAGNQERFKLQYDDRHYRVCVVPIQPENEAITHAITVFENITEQTRQQRELERQNEQLDEFAQVVSHDLQSPLTVAQNSLELAQETHNGEHLSRASDALARSQALVDDLLALAKQGKEAIEYEPIALEEFAQQVWHTVETGPAMIEVDAAQPIHADRSQLRQLLENLYLNAIEHGGSDVTVSVGTTDNGFYIADTGPGIAESSRTEVFEPGYSTSDDGTGFGLRIVERIVEMHGWEITVTESEENGARFDITGVEFSE